MKRRDFVKGIAVATAGTAFGQQQSTRNPPPANDAPPPALASTPPTARRQQTARFHTSNIPLSQPDVVAVTETNYFTPVRYATLVRLCEVFVPASEDYPSAIKTGTPEFLDFYLGASPTEQQSMYNNGLDRLNADCLMQFGVPFAKADDRQADAVIRPHLRGWMNDHPPTEVHVRFINLAHRDIREAAMNSPAWAAAAEASGERTPGVALYWNPIEPTIQTWAQHGEARTATVVNPRQA